MWRTESVVTGQGSEGKVPEAESILSFRSAN